MPRVKKRRSAVLLFWAFGGVIVVGVIVAFALLSPPLPASIPSGESCDLTESCADPRDACYGEGSGKRCHRVCDFQPQDCPGGTTCHRLEPAARPHYPGITGVCL